MENQNYRECFVIGRNNFALTIFIPIDCDNNCPFCTSKSDYQDHKPDLDKITESLEKISKHKIYFKDVVITGGEPLKDLELLQSLIMRVKHYIKFDNLYINTTMPEEHSYDSRNYITCNDTITGINISRHIKTKFDSVTDIIPPLQRWSNQPEKPIHINCVLEDVDSENLEHDIEIFVNTYKKYGRIVFREDYRKTTRDTLHSISNKIFNKLDSMYGFQYSTSCNVCHTDIFGEDGNIVFHRGLEYSSIKFSRFTEVNDLIIRQDGLLCYDWDRNKIADDFVLGSLRLSQTSTLLFSKSINKSKSVEIDNNDNRICQICKYYNSKDKCTNCEKTVAFLEKKRYLKPIIIKCTAVEYTYPCSSEPREDPFVNEYTYKIRDYDAKYFVNTGKYRLIHDLHGSRIVELCDDSVQPNMHKWRTLSEPVKIDTKLDKQIIFDGHIKYYNRLMDYLKYFKSPSKKSTRTEWPCKNMPEICPLSREPKNVNDCLICASTYDEDYKCGV